MSWADTTNGLLELAGGVFVMLSIFKVIDDKKVRGVSWVHVSFFTVWGVWNLYYYPSLDQWFSFVGGLFLVSVNAVWVALLLYYTLTEDMTDDG